MTVETNIIFELKRKRDFDERVIVRRHTRVRFIVRIWQEFLNIYKITSRPISFILYFEQETPDGFVFPRNNQATAFGTQFDRQFNDFYSAYYDVVILEGTVETPGEYKYGLKAEYRNEELFDDDPYLIVI